MRLFNIVLAAGIVMISVSFTIGNNYSEESIVGKWQWRNVIDIPSGKEKGLETIMMGMTKDVMMEFKSDHVYTESKLGMGSADYSNTSGEWKLENGNMLSTYRKEKWKQNTIMKLTEDSLIIEMNPQMALLMVKMK